MDEFNKVRSSLKTTTHGNSRKSGQETRMPGKLRARQSQAATPCNNAAKPMSENETEASHGALRGHGYTSRRRGLRPGWSSLAAFSRGIHTLRPWVTVAAPCARRLARTRGPVRLPESPDFVAR